MTCLSSQTPHRSSPRLLGKSGLCSQSWAWGRGQGGRRLPDTSTALCDHSTSSAWPWPLLAQASWPGTRPRVPALSESLVFLLHPEAACQHDRGHRSAEPHSFLAMIWFSHFYFKSLGNKSPGRSGWLDECLSKVLPVLAGVPTQLWNQNARAGWLCSPAPHDKNRNARSSQTPTVCLTWPQRGRSGPRSLGGLGCHLAAVRGHAMLSHAGVYRHGPQGASPGRRWALEGNGWGR